MRCPVPCTGLHRAEGRGPGETSRKRQAGRETPSELVGGLGKTEKQTQQEGKEERTELVTVCAGGDGPHRRGRVKML